MAYVCPPCKRIIEPSTEPSIWVLVEGRSCREVSAQQPKHLSPDAIICLVHVVHFNAFKTMVEGGDYPPKSD